MKNIDIENVDIDIDKAILENINIDKDNLENIDIDSDKDMLENIDINICIKKDSLDNKNNFFKKKYAFLMEYRYRLSIYHHF